MYAELDEARRALAESPAALVPSDASLESLSLQSRLSEALREKEAALEAAHEAEERAVHSARAQIQGLEERLGEALSVERGQESNLESARAQTEGVEGPLAEAERTAEELALLRSQISELEQRCDAAESALESEKRARADVEESLGETERANAENETVVAEFRAKLDALLPEKSGVPEAEVPGGLLGPGSEAEIELAAKTEQLVQTESALAEARQLVAELLNKKEGSPPGIELAEARAKIAELEGDLEEAVRVLEEDDVRRAEQQAELRKLEEELASARTELTAKCDVSADVEGLREEVARLRSVEGELEQARKQLAERAEVPPVAPAFATEASETAAKQLEVLGSEKLELEGRIESLTAELKDAQSRAERAETDGRALFERAEEITKEKVALEERLRELEEEGSLLTETREELARAHEQQARLQSAGEAAVVELETQLEALKEAGEERKGLLKTIAAMEGERQKMEQVMQSTGDDKDALLRSAEAAVREKEGMLAEMGAEHARLEGAVSELQSDKEALRKALEESERRVEAVERERDEAATELRTQLQRVRRKS